MSLQTIEHLFALSSFDTAAPAHADGAFSIALSKNAAPFDLAITIQDGVAVLARDVVIDGTGYSQGAVLSIAYCAATKLGTSGFGLAIDQETVGFFTLNPLNFGKTYDFDTANALPVDQQPSKYSYFRADTRIKTTRGEIAICDIAVGDKVITRDHGLQTVRWTGARLLPGVGEMAPIVIDAGVLGCEADLVVSPDHRMLIAGVMSELYLGADESLVFAKLLINKKNVRRAPANFVPYAHIMFDQHEVIWGNGCLSESFYIGDHGIDALGSGQQDEIASVLVKNPDDITLARGECHAHEGRVIAAALL